MNLIIPIMATALFIGIVWKKMTAVSWMLLIAVIVLTIGRYAMKH